MSEFMQRPSKPTAANAAAAGQKAVKKATTKSSKMHIGAGMLVIAGALLAAATLSLLLLNNKSAISQENDLIEDSQYQAVFLNTADGQVYFGNLASYSKDLYTLSDIYYVQVQTQTQPETGQQQTTGVSLAKLGNELHGPEDSMHIQKDQVLYWENLKSSGQVACAIAQYQIDELELDITRDPACDEREAEAAANQQQQPAAVDPSASATQPVGTPQVNDTPATTPETPAQ